MHAATTIASQNERLWAAVKLSARTKTLSEGKINFQSPRKCSNSRHAWACV